MKSKMLDNVSFVIGALSIVLFCVFSKDIEVACIIGGVGSSLFGICSLLKKEKMGYVFLSMGISVGLGATLFVLEVLNQSDTITFVLCLSLALLMSLSVIYNYINELEIKKKYSLVVEGKVIDLVKNPNTMGEYYQPIYEYEIDNKVYAAGFPGYKKNFIPKIGDTLKIFIEPDDHASAYFDKTFAEKFYNYSISIFLAIVSIIIVITLFI